MALRVKRIGRRWASIEHGYARSAAGQLRRGCVLPMAVARDRREGREPTDLAKGIERAFAYGHSCSVALRYLARRLERHDPRGAEGLRRLGNAESEIKRTCKRGVRRF